MRMLMRSPTRNIIGTFIYKDAYKEPYDGA